MWFFIILGLFAGSLSFDLPHSRWIFDVKLPVLSTGIANRILFIPAFSISVLAALALQSWTKARNKARKQATFATLILVGATFLVIWVVLWKIAPTLPFDPFKIPRNWVTISRRNSVIPTAVFLGGGSLLLIGALKKKLLLLSTAILVIGATAQNLYQFNKFTPFSESQFTYPVHSTVQFLQENAGINRYIGYNGVYLQYNYATQFNIFSLEGYDSLNDFRRAQLIFSAIKSGELSYDIPRSSDVVLARSLDYEGVPRMMQLAGIKYLVDHSEYTDVINKDSLPTLPEDKQTLVFEDRDWKIYEYSDALPRALLAGDYIVEPEDQKAADLIFNPDINLRDTVILEQNPLGIKPEPDPDAKVEVVSYTPNKITFETSSTKDQLLFLSDTYYPGWKANIDNQKTDVLQANFAFRAVPVPSGKHQIVMYYRPESFIYGLYIASVTVFLIIIATKLVKINPDKQSK